MNDNLIDSRLKGLSLEAEKAHVRREEREACAKVAVMHNCDKNCLCQVRIAQAIRDRK